MILDADKLQEIFQSLKRHKLRTFLTGFGVAWGIFMLVILLGSGQGLEKGILSNFSGYASNTIAVYGGVTTKSYKGLGTGRSVAPSSRDLQILRNQIPEIKLLSPKIQLTAGGSVNYKDQSGSYSVEGVTDDLFKIEQFDIKAGRLINSRDEAKSRKVAIIGKKSLEQLFDNKNPIGEQIQISGETFKVIGVFDKDASGFMNYESHILIPASTMQQTYSQKDEIRQFILIPKEGISSKVVENKIRQFMANLCQFDPTDRRALWISNIEEQFKQFNSLFSGISIFLWGVGLGTLLGGIVGVGNIMFIAVKERTREIGIRKALGATPRAVVSQILLESIFITVLAGFVGILLGSGVLFGIGFIMDKMPSSGMSFFIDPQIDLGITLSAMILLVAFGALAGWIPSRQAAKVDPIEALRYE